MAKVLLEEDAFLVIDSIHWIRELVGCGMSLELRNRNGFTALQEACCCHNLLFVRTLCEAGADKNILTENGATLLHLVCYGITFCDRRRDRKQRRVLVARFLLEQGLEPQVLNADGKTALDFARHFGHDEIVEILTQKLVK